MKKTLWAMPNYLTTTVIFRPYSSFPAVRPHVKPSKSRCNTYYKFLSFKGIVSLSCSAFNNNCQRAPNSLNSLTARSRYQHSWKSNFYTHTIFLTASALSFSKGCCVQFCGCCYCWKWHSSFSIVQQCNLDLPELLYLILIQW